MTTSLTISIMRISLLVTLSMVAFTGLLILPVSCLAPWWVDLIGIGIAIVALVLVGRLYERWATVDPLLRFYDSFISKDTEL